MSLCWRSSPLAPCEGTWLWRGGSACSQYHMSSRVRRFRRYECCFTGKDAVAWLTSNDKAATPEEAVILGNDLLRAGLLHHVSFKRPFQDKDSLYRCCMLHTLC